MFFFCRCSDFPWTIQWLEGSGEDFTECWSYQDFPNLIAETCHGYLSQTSMISHEIRHGNPPNHLKKAPNPSVAINNFEGFDCRGGDTEILRVCSAGCMFFQGQWEYIWEMLCGIGMKSNTHINIHDSFCWDKHPLTSFFRGLVADDWFDQATCWFDQMDWEYSTINPCFLKVNGAMEPCWLMVRGEYCQPLTGFLEMNKLMDLCLIVALLY